MIRFVRSNLLFAIIHLSYNSSLFNQKFINTYFSYNNILFSEFFLLRIQLIFYSIILAIWVSTYNMLWKSYLVRLIIKTNKSTYLKLLLIKKIITKKFRKKKEYHAIKPQEQIEEVFKFLHYITRVIIGSYGIDQ